MVKLGVNIDHVATLRNARGGCEPEPVQAVFQVIQSGADSITIHLREDRRHINDRDLKLIRELINVPLNLEMALTDEMIDIAVKTKPDYVCLVPENRQEITTEGGLNVLRVEEKMKKSIKILNENGISVSLFIDPESDQIECSARCGADMIELHTGKYANADNSDKEAEFLNIKKSTDLAISLGLIVNAGHGLNYQNTARIAAIEGMNELNIGHSIISRSVFTGLNEAVKEMKKIIETAGGI